MGKKHTFYSPLPPECIPGILPGEARSYDQLKNTEVRVRTTWRNRRFAVRRTTMRRYTTADGWVPRVSGRGWTWGLRTDWQWNNPFCGEVRPDGRGGSVLTGRFRIHPAGKLMFAVFPLLGVYSLYFLSPHNVETLIMAIVAVALYLRHLIHACRAIDSYDGVEDILHFLRENFEEVEE